MHSSSNAKPVERLAGQVDRIVFHNEETGFCVLKVKVKGQKQLVSVVGSLTEAAPGEVLEATGQWVIDPNFGQQFKAETLQTTHPATSRGIERFLASRIIRGIGPQMAAKIVALYKERSLEILDKYPEMLLHIKGMGRKRLKMVQESWREHKAVRDIMVFLYTHGIGSARAFTIYRQYGERAIDLIKENPYRLAEEVRGIGFVTADELAQRLGIDRASPFRARAAVMYILLELAEAQQEAVRQACRCKMLVITGGPGVGKTTLVRSLLEIFEARGLTCVLAAPTGRAAKRLAETTGRKASTVHRLLQYNPELGGFQRGPGDPLEGDLFVLDEVSMVDVSLGNHYLAAVPDHACVVLVGDVDQLPSVGPGTVLRDIIDSGAVPVVRLTHIFRQARKSRIVTSAYAVNHGEMPDLEPPVAGLADFYFIEADEPSVIQNTIVKLVQERIPQRFGFAPMTEIQVLTPMNKTQLGSRNLNQVLQEALNPPKGQPQLERFGWVFREGDRVIQTENNYDKEVFNGDLGLVQRIDRESQEVVVNFDGRDVSYRFPELEQLALAYVLTIHKSQGSEYPCVIIPLHTQHFVMLQRNLLYTAITRGKKLVVIVGTRKALQLAVQRQDTARRYTALRERLEMVRGGRQLRTVREFE